MSEQEQEQGFIGAGHEDPELSLTPLAIVPLYSWEQPEEVTLTPDVPTPGSGFATLFNPKPFEGFPAWHPPAATHYMWFISGEVWNNGADPASYTWLSLAPELIFSPDPGGQWITVVSNDGVAGWTSLQGSHYIGHGADGTETWLMGLGLSAEEPAPVKARNLKFSVYIFQ